VEITHNAIITLYNFKQRTASEWSSACPKCGPGPKDTDRFRYWPEDGRYWCRKCGFFGWTDENNNSRYLGPETWQNAAESEKTPVWTEARQRLQEYRPDLTYHHRLNGEASLISDRWGLANSTIEGHKLGYCDRCPTYLESDSITIPYYWKEQLIHLQHRLLKPNGSGKYRPHMAGLSVAIFNADVLRGDFTDFVVIVEGAMKAMRLEQEGLPVVGIFSKNSWKDEWGTLLKRFETVFICLDPDAYTDAHALARRIAGFPVQVRVANPPVKPDDWFAKYGMGLGPFCQMLEQGRLYR